MANPSRIGSLRVDGLEIPVHFFFEARRGSRVSLGKNAVLVRLPLVNRNSNLKKDIQWIQKWLINLYAKKPEHFIRLAHAQTMHQDREVIALFDRDITLSIVYNDHRKTISGKLIENTIQLVLHTATSRHQSSMLISRILAQNYQDHFEEKVNHYNALHFNKPVKSIRIKYNSSNWGSCSSKSNINLSSRLLLTPELVQDYIVIHELAHLTEMNHSSRFWSLVEKAMPDYNESEKWLKEKGVTIDF